MQLSHLGQSSYSASESLANWLEVFTELIKSSLGVGLSYYALRSNCCFSGAGALSRASGSGGSSAQFVG